MPANVLTPQSEDFPAWYQEVVAKADLAESGAARGTMIVKPWGYAIWERIAAALDAEIKAAGADNVYFPMFIPAHFLEKEAAHVEGFSPELAVVTHAGGEDLSEPLVVRPTSETVIGDAMGRWVQGHRDLPLKLNQWSNVVRWELRPRLFLRTTEFLWQEGHTAQADWHAARTDTLGMLEAYRRVFTDTLALPAVVGRKTEAEKFAGAEVTYTLEGLMRDRRALQMGTSHHMGQNFASAFDITFSDASGVERYAYTTSWGVSTRVVGGLIMTHGDDRGLRLPPAIAPVQVVVIAVREEAAEAARGLSERLSAAGVRVRLDDDTHTGFGRRVVDWELKGVPVRVELGPRDLEAEQATLALRHEDGKRAVGLVELPDRIAGLLDEVHTGLWEQAAADREAGTVSAESADELSGDAGLAYRIPWDALGAEGEAKLDEQRLSVRCLTTSEGGVPEPHEADDLVAWVARAY